MTDAKAQLNRDGTMTVTVAIPPTPEWATYLDSAFHRLHEFESKNLKWHFVSLSVPSYSFGYICVLEKKGVTHSMSGSAGLEMAVAGFGSSEVEAIDTAIRLATLYDSSDAKAAYDAEQAAIAAEPG